jgi:addiction module HigA family antidote
MSIWSITIKGETFMRMKNPPHPGRIVRQECIEPLGLTVTDAAAALGVTRQALTNLVTGKAGVSPEMAIRLSKVFGSSADMWLGLQMDYDLAHVEKKAVGLRLKRLAPKAAAA